MGVNRNVSVFVLTLLSSVKSFSFFYGVMAFSQTFTSGNHKEVFLAWKLASVGSWNLFVFRRSSVHPSQVSLNKSVTPYQLYQEGVQIKSISLLGSVKTSQNTNLF